jgi:hypothetical protein
VARDRPSSLESLASGLPQGRELQSRIWSLVDTCIRCTFCPRGIPQIG